MRILYAEDELGLSQAVTEILQIEEYDVTPVYDGAEALDKLMNETFDGVILDVMMPKMDGFEVLKKMREAQIFTPVLMLTAKSATDDMVQGFDMGADYYLPKPFKMAELMARINAMLRRTTSYRRQEFTCGNTTLSTGISEVTTPTGSLRLSTKETELLALGLKNVGKEMTTEWLSENVFDSADEKDGVELYVSYLNNKLKQIRSDLHIDHTDNVFILSEITEKAI